MKADSYHNEYIVPKEEELIRLPLKVLQMLAKKNSVTSSGAKKAIVGRLYARWDGVKPMEWTTTENLLTTLDPVEAKKHGKIQSSFSLLQFKDVYLPVFGHDYQEVWQD